MSRADFVWYWPHKLQQLFFRNHFETKDSPLGLQLTVIRVSKHHGKRFFWCRCGWFPCALFCRVVSLHVITPLCLPQESSSSFCAISHGQKSLSATHARMPVERG